MFTRIRATSLTRADDFALQQPAKQQPQDKKDYKTWTIEAGESVSEIMSCNASNADAALVNTKESAARLRSKPGSCRSTARRSMPALHPLPRFSRPKKQRMLRIRAQDLQR
jgi:hypothetical protein